MHLTLFAIVLSLLASPSLLTSPPANSERPLPEFTSSAPENWLNSAPLTTADLRGKVLIVDVWTFSCWNCYRSFPWLHALEKRYRDDGLQVIGIHSPEFKHEKDAKNIRKAMKKHGVTYPNLIDNDFKYWRALGNRYWPTFYLVDKQGVIRHTMVGETHAGGKRAREFEQKVRELLSEKYLPANAK